ncbi:MAG TPA: DUF3592 domain-containing protein [Terracidiphilus sp.]|nr:DUF3592 domain-containing protein [Terracidiphilus sp.]
MQVIKLMLEMTQTPHWLKTWGSPVGELQNLPKWRRFVLTLAGFFGLLTGLCVVFLLLVTAALAWEDHAHAQWPEATEQVQRCSLDLYPPDPKYYRIDCGVNYTVRGEEILSHVYSRTTPDPSRIIWEYSSPQLGRLQEWVDAHPKGTRMVVHYDPANHKKAVLIVTDMPLGGTQIPGCLRLLEVAAASCVVLLAIARILMPRPIATH